MVAVLALNRQTGRRNNHLEYLLVVIGQQPVQRAFPQPGPRISPGILETSLNLRPP